MLCDDLGNPRLRDSLDPLTDSRGRVWRTGSWLVRHQVDRRLSELDRACAYRVAHQVEGPRRGVDAQAFRLLRRPRHSDHGVGRVAAGEDVKRVVDDGEDVPMQALPFDDPEREVTHWNIFVKVAMPAYIVRGMPPYSKSTPPASGPLMRPAAPAWKKIFSTPCAKPTAANFTMCSVAARSLGQRQRFMEASPILNGKVGGVVIGVASPLGDPDRPPGAVGFHQLFKSPERRLVRLGGPGGVVDVQVDDVATFQTPLDDELARVSRRQPRTDAADDLDLRVDLLDRVVGHLKQLHVVGDRVTELPGQGIVGVDRLVEDLNVQGADRGPGRGDGVLNWR